MTIPIFQKFPELAPKIPYLSFDLKMPKVYMPRQEYPNAWTISVGNISDIYGGNKSYRLEFLLADALEKKRKHVITLGSIGSNHCVATAAFSKQLGLKCTTVLCHQPFNQKVVANLERLLHYHAELHFISSSLKAGFAFYIWLRWKYPKAYFIDVGGSDNVGMLGALNAAFAFIQRIKTHLPITPDVIFFPTASNGGLSALMIALHLSQLDCEVKAIRVGSSYVGPFAMNTPKTIRKCIKGFCRFLQSYGIHLDELSIKSPTLVNDYFGAAYAQPTEKGKVATNYFAQHYALDLDPAYSSKTAAAFLDYVKLHPQKTVVFYHSFNTVKAPVTTL